jgi:hypothetical protein
MFIKSLRLSGLLAVAATCSAQAQPLALYENFGLVDATSELPIDAESFANYGSFSVFSTLPFDTQNTLNFTNRGLMAGSVGFNFQHIASDGKRGPAMNFVNERGGEILAGPPGQESDPSYLLIEAENVINQGRLSVGAGGLIRINGDNINLFNAGIEINPIEGSGTFNGTNTFIPDSGLIDEYWGGVTNVIGDSASVLRLSGNTLSVRSPTHSATNRFFQPLSIDLSFQSPNAFVISNALTETNIIVQAVFAVMGDSSIQTSARFAPSALTNTISTVMLEMVVPITNVVDGATDIFKLYLSDTLAWHTNHSLLKNVNDITQRPFTYELSRIEPNDWFGGGPPQDIEITPDLLWGTTYSNTTVTNLYAAYSANVDNIVTPRVLIEEADIAELPGRVEINAGNLNLNNTRFRGEGLISINADHLVDSRGAIIDSQNVSFNLASTNGVLNVQDLGRTSIKRFNGQLRAFSMVWTNQSGSITEDIVVDATAGTTTTNSVTNVIDIFHHVMIVDGTQLRTSVPVLTHDFVANGDSVTLNDSMSVLNSFTSDAELLTNEGEIFFADTFANFGSTNLPNVKEFVNNGAFSISEIADFGFDRATPLERFINRGAINAFSARISTDYFENSGDINGGGRVVIQSGTAKLEGGSLLSGRDIDITGQDVKLRNYQMASGLRLGIDVSGTLTDSGPTANNRISVGDGFVLHKRPTAGDLLGTSINSNIPRFFRVDHTWAAEDRGPSADGFKNNAALGTLQLTGPTGSEARFSAAGGSGAMYIEFLQFNDGFESAGSGGLVIDEGMVVYFADSNLPVESLDGAHNGRLRWVRDFAGTNSSIDVVVADTGRTVRVNRGLRESLIIDSDGDGTANGIDLTPFDGVILTDLGVSAGEDLITTTLSWVAAAGTEYRVEFRGSVGHEGWEFLKGVSNESSDRQKLTVTDEVPKGNGSRFYRVTYLP